MQRFTEHLFRKTVTEKYSNYIKASFKLFSYFDIDTLRKLPYLKNFDLFVLSQSEGGAA